MSAASDIYVFGPFRLDKADRRLTREGEQIELRMKVFDTLCVLVENAGHLMTKEDLLQAVWPGTAVEENNLNHNISVLRKALGERETGPKYIQTVARVGYRFTAPVTREGPVAQEAPAATAAPAPAQRLRQEIRYCMTPDGVRLAYASVGEGPAFVKASNWLTHLDYEW